MIEELFAIQNRLVHNTDFVVREGKWDFEAEVGGRSKKRKKIKGLGNVYIFKDGIEIGRAYTLPLYLAGFLY